LGKKYTKQVLRNSCSEIVYLKYEKLEVMTRVE